MQHCEADVLVVAKLDRMCRSVMDMAQVLKWAAMKRKPRGANRNVPWQKGWEFVTLDMNMDTTTPYGQAMVNLFAMFAELERDLIADRTKSALAAKRATGWQPGRPVQITDETAATILALRSQGLSLPQICKHLKLEGVRTARGGQWAPATVARVLRRYETREAA